MFSRQVRLPGAVVAVLGPIDVDRGSVVVPAVVLDAAESVEPGVDVARARVVAASQVGERPLDVRLGVVGDDERLAAEIGVIGQVGRRDVVVDQRVGSACHRSTFRASCAFGSTRFLTMRHLVAPRGTVTALAVSLVVPNCGRLRRPYLDTVALPVIPVPRNTHKEAHPDDSTHNAAHHKAARWKSM